MKPIKIFVVLFATAALFWGCSKNKTEDPVAFKFRLLDTLGNEKTVFNEGENIIFSFLIENKSDSDLYFQHSMMNIKDFFRIIKLNTAEGNLDIGKPYEHIFCEYRSSVRISKNGLLKIEIPWLWNENQSYEYIGCPNTNYHKDTNPLKNGNYITSFSSSFEFGNFHTEVKQFEINFSIK